MQVAASVLNQLRAVEDGRAVLRGLREMVALASAGNQADVSRLANAGAPDLLLTALDRHVGNPEIAKIGLAALAVLVGGRPAVATWVVSIGAVETIRTSARSFESDAALSLQASRALLAVASAHTFSAAPSTAAAPTEPSLGEPHRAHAAEVLLSVLERHPCDLAVALSACKALCHVATGDDAARAAAATLAALYVHRKDALMCRVCCRLIHILCAASEPSRSHVLASTAVEDIAAIIQLHPSRLEIVTEACSALERLGIGAAGQCGGAPSGATVVALFFQAGVYPALLGVMHRHSHVASLTGSGCNILSLCADADQAVKDSIVPGDRGAAAVAVSALVRHSAARWPADSAESARENTVDDATICTQAAQAVAALALNSTLAQASLGEAGAIDALLLALRVHRDRSIVLCRVVVVALSALCADCVSNMDSLHKQEGVGQIVRAARYTGDETLCVETCRAVAAWCEPGENSLVDWRCTPAGSDMLTLACTMLQGAVARGACGTGGLPDTATVSSDTNEGMVIARNSEVAEHQEGPEVFSGERDRENLSQNPKDEERKRVSEHSPEPEPEPENTLGHIQHFEEFYSEMTLRTIDACCRALEGLLQEETLRSLALAQGVVQLCLAALKTHVNQVSVCVSVCRAVVSALGERDHKTQKCLREEGGLPLLVGLLQMGEYVIEPRLDSASLRALLAATSGSSSRMKTTQHGVNARAILRLGGANALYRVLIVEARGGLERCVQLSLKVVVNLAMEAEAAEIHEMNNAGLTHAVYHAMQRHAASGKVLGLGCRALICLCSDLYVAEEPSEAVLLLRNAALQLLYQALPRHLDDRRLQKYGKQVLTAGTCSVRY